MQINELEPFAKNYLAALKEIDRKRTQWHNETRMMIVEVLNSVNTLYKIGWQVEENNSIRNAEYIFLILYNKSSGISQVNPDDLYNAKQYVKTNTYLAFTLYYNGNVRVYMRFPEIEELFESHIQIKELGMFDPFAITKEMIIEFVKIFLEEITSWESGNSLRPLI